jgi:hypothetical protein
MLFLFRSPGDLIATIATLPDQQGFQQGIQLPLSPWHLAAPNAAPKYTSPTTAFGYRTNIGLSGAAKRKPVSSELSIASSWAQELGKSSLPFTLL